MAHLRSSLPDGSGSPERPRLAAMTDRDRAYVARDLLPEGGAEALETAARVIPLDYGQLAYRARRQNRAMLALGAVLRVEGWYPFEALQAAARETQRDEIAALNLEALEASAGLIQ